MKKALLAIIMILMFITGCILNNNFIRFSVNIDGWWVLGIETASNTTIKYQNGPDFIDIDLDSAATVKVQSTALHVELSAAAHGTELWDVSSEDGEIILQIDAEGNKL